LLNAAKVFDKINLIDEHDEWIIPVKYILEKGDFLHFKNEENGFERQIFIPLEKIENFKKQPTI
jgi:hypothetical protein